MADAVPSELRTRMDAATPSSSTPEQLTAAARERLSAVLDLVEQGKAVRSSGGLNPASAALLVADALLTEAAARAATDGAIDGVLTALDLEALIARARAVDEAGS